MFPTGQTPLTVVPVNYSQAPSAFGVQVHVLPRLGVIWLGQHLSTASRLVEPCVLIGFRPMSASLTLDMLVRCPRAPLTISCRRIHEHRCCEALVEGLALARFRQRVRDRSHLSCSAYRLCLQIFQGLIEQCEVVSNIRLCVAGVIELSFVQHVTKYTRAQVDRLLCTSALTMTPSSHDVPSACFLPWSFSA